MAYWYISKTKLKFEDKESIEPIPLKDWQKVVEEDQDLMWYEMTPLGKEDLYGEFTSESDRNKRIKTAARMELNKKGNGKVQLNYLNQSGYMYIAIIHPRENIKLIEKYFEIANKLNAKLFKSKMLIDQNKINSIREKGNQRKIKSCNEEE